MKFFYQSTVKNLMLGCAMLVSGSVFAQTNPTPQAIPYNQDFSGLAHASTTYPAGIQGWKVSSAATTSFVTTGPTGDHLLLASSSASSTAGGVLNYNGKVGTLASGSTNPGIALALITSGKSNIRVNYDIMVIRNPYDGASNTRLNEATLQYRVGTSGAFTTLTGIEYQSGTTLQTTSGVTTPQNLLSRSIILPAACNNQAEIQIRWITRDITGSGSRPSFAVDNIAIDADSDLDTYYSAVDCNDNNASIYPGATEICNFIDDDCDGVTDDGIAYLIFYTDADIDNYGDASAAGANYCTDPGAGYATTNTDCNDGDASINPGATEVCNGIDDDCDGAADNGLTFIVYYGDIDDDGFGDEFITTTTCDGTPSGYELDGTDCDDANASVYPGATEVCNGIDEDCDGAADNGLTFIVYYGDIDDDGFGDEFNTTTTCDGTPSGYELDGTDCDDANASVYPGATEVCNGIDDDCDGAADNGLTFVVYYGDIDDDGFGDEFNTTTTCDGVPSGYVLDNTDCDDTQNTVYPGGVEVCDGLDNDCDGSLDEGTVSASITPIGTVLTCKGVPTTLTANAGIDYTYQWFKNGNIIIGATASTYGANKPGNYQVQVNSPEGCFALSEPTFVSVLANPNANVSAPNGTSLCASVKLKASYDVTYTWQWNNAGVPIPGATSYLYFATTAGSYTCTVTATSGCSRTSNAIVVTACKEGEIAQTSVDAAKLVTYPNPADNLFTIELELDVINAEADITVFNILGEVVYASNTTLFNGILNTAVDATSFTSGAYIVSVNIGGKIYTTNLMISK